MKHILACLSFALALAFYGLLIVWFVNLARVGGIAQVPHMLRSLGWEAALYGTGLGVLGTFFVCAGAAAVGRKQ